MFNRLFLMAIVAIALTLVLLRSTPALVLAPFNPQQPDHTSNAATHLEVIGKEKHMNNQENDVLSLVQLKIRKRIVACLKKDFELEGNRGFQVGFGDRMDIWLPISPDFKNQWSDERAVVIMERVFGRKFQQIFQVQWPQSDDIWFPIPPNLSLEGWSDEEVRTIAGKLVMISWNFVPANFTHEELAKEMLMLVFSIHPGMIFEDIG